MIHIVDYGVGNLGSIQNMLKRVGYPSQITSNADEIAGAQKIIFPGVGAFDAGMQKIRESGLQDVLNEHAVVKKKPILGICLGMQLMTNGSEEGVEKGLGWIDADTLKFNFDGANSHLKIPHMGWNEVSFSKQHELITDLPQPSRFYFVHSYYIKCRNQQDELLRCHYGFDFTCSFQHQNIMGVQFHAEKSHRFGMQIFKNFAERC